MALPAKKLPKEQSPDEPIRLLTKTPSETESGNQFIDNTARTIAKEYGVLGASDTNKEVVRSRVKAVTDELNRQFSRDTDGNIDRDDEENVNKVRAAVKFDLHHIDGDDQNHIPTNLQLLCLNCHGLTPNFGRKNISPSSKALKYLRGELNKGKRMRE